MNNMRKFFTLTLLLTATRLAADTSDSEIAKMDHLVASTEKHLEQEKRLNTLMRQFDAQKTLFIEGEQTKGHTALMVHTATRILEAIAAEHLQHLFSQEYLEELAFFSSIASKHKPSRP
jgi:hypothetical protein